MKNKSNTTEYAIPLSGKRSVSVDPILAELWAIKRQINEEANFSLDAIVERARTFTIEEARLRVRSALNDAQRKLHH